MDSVNFQIDTGERVGLIGRNGEGKSTLLKLIAGKISADGGEFWRDSGLRLAMLDQAPDFSDYQTIFDVVAGGLGSIGEWISEYHLLSADPTLNEKGLQQLGKLHNLLDANDGWMLQQRVETVLSRLDLPGDLEVGSLSGGWLRRVALARVLVIEPDLLLLDEPTNHLDLETILWLENHLLEFTGAVLLITHDRSFLQKLATRIVDLDRGKLVSWPGEYADYLKLKAAALVEEEAQNAEFDKKLAKEEVWIRQGIKARRTRNEGRVRALKKMRSERSQRRNRDGQVSIHKVSSEKSGKRAIEVENVSLSYASTPVIKDFSMTLLRGDRVGLIGPNGVGKTTLLKLLLKQIEPDSGSVKLGTRLEIAYFDQMRGQLDTSETVMDWIADGSDFITISNNRRHVLSYLADFLFVPQRARSPISSLSGGEKNRLLLAKLFSRSANLLVMDEPTNDLDIETLELLEESLLNFEGSLLLVSHDRSFLDNVVTSTLVFEGKGQVTDYVGGYSDWLNQKPSEEVSEIKNNSKSREVRQNKQKNKLSYKQKRELEALPGKIEEMEHRQADLNQTIASRDFYQNEKSEITETLEALNSLNKELEQLYYFWDELESLQKKYSES